MAFVHCLVPPDGVPTGWIAPTELGEKSPHDISFAAPLSPEGKLRDEYICEVAFTDDAPAASRKQTAYTMRKKSDTTLLLTIGQYELWFIVTPTTQNRKRRRYVGNASHEDFAFPLIEIEPRDVAAVDRLCEREGIFIIGCDPFTRYRGIGASEKPHRSVGDAT